MRGSELDFAAFPRTVRQEIPAFANETGGSLMMPSMPASDSHNPPDARDVVWELEAEVERLRALIQIHREERDAELAARRRALAEVARLREALEAILNEFDPGENDPVARLAREALEAGER